MTRHYKLTLILLALLAGVHTVEVRAQSTAPAVEGWRVHLPFINNHAICESGNKIFVGSHSGVFTLDESDKSIEVLSKVNGLSDVEVKLLATDPVTGSVFVIYEDANIDIIEGNNIYTISSIYTQSMIGDKSINNVSFYNNFAYLSCSFGIVVIEVDRKRIADSYTYLGANGTNLPVSDVEVYDGYIYASSTAGIYRASQGSFNLNDYHSWSMIKPSAFSSHMAVFRNRLYAVIDSTVQTYDGSTWSPFGTNILNPAGMNINHNKLVCTKGTGIITEDPNGTVSVKTINGLQAALIGNNDIIYACGFNTGLMIINPNGAVDFYNPPGPYGKTASRFAYNMNDNTLWVAGGTINGFGSSSGWGNGYNNYKFYRFTDNSWYNYNNTGNPLIENARDFIDVAINPADNHVFIATVQFGLYEIESVTPFKFTVYDTSNSTLRDYNGGPFVSGVCFDNRGILWASNFGAVNPVSAKVSGQWYSYKLPSQADGMALNPYVGFITTDDNNNKWILTTKGNGIIVYNDHNRPDLPAIHEVKVLQKEKQKGFLPSNTVFCITKDQKGEMWVGTDQGLCIFSNTSNIFKANADYDAHQLVIKTGLVYSNFLGTGSIYCIRVDAANRKWIGTKNGVWLVSADGYTVIKNFTSANSPLLSDIVYDIGINDKTGEVFFATEKGIISYMGTATAGLDTHGDVLVYPNPVRPEYQGLIAIRGLVNEANVKITDIAGNLVYETKASGGMATWNGLNMLGKRAATGVYIIYSSNEDATEQWVGKILFIN